MTNDIHLPLPFYLYFSFDVGFETNFVLPDLELPDFETFFTNLIEGTTGLQDIMAEKLKLLSGNFGISNPDWLGCGTGLTPLNPLGGLLGCLWDKLGIDADLPSISANGFLEDVGVTNLFEDISSTASDTAEIM